MIKNKYFAKLKSVASFFFAHFQIMVFLCFAVFFFYLAMLGIEITSVINDAPSAEIIDKKIQNVKIRKDLIKKIDTFMILRQKHHYDLSDKNPFLPYKKESDSLPVNELTPTLTKPSTQKLP